jgi:hypothetical protein
MAILLNHVPPKQPFPVRAKARPPLVATWHMDSAGRLVCNWVLGDADGQRRFFFFEKKKQKTFGNVDVQRRAGRVH